MLHLTYDPIFGVSIHYVSGPVGDIIEDRAEVAFGGSAHDEPLVDATSRTVEAGGQANCAGEGDPHSGD